MGASGNLEAVLDIAITFTFDVPPRGVLRSAWAVLAQGRAHDDLAAVYHKAIPVEAVTLTTQDEATHFEDVTSWLNRLIQGDLTSAHLIGRSQDIALFVEQDSIQTIVRCAHHWALATNVQLGCLCYLKIVTLRTTHPL
ncbi:hypothetical protein C1H69_14985 [Billgrantia endophytica]|uniref:Uncharacterized protein n=1 Tax=Billgrantia endophytica TaxID=2033802 RepID=A0A2N7U0Z1_9GAMM|nr:hypothetical protein C1H69_14985 [Halomonas endophytica]